MEKQGHCEAAKAASRAPTTRAGSSQLQDEKSVHIGTSRLFCLPPARRHVGHQAEQIQLSAWLRRQMHGRSPGCRRRSACLHACQVRFSSDPAPRQCCRHRSLECHMCSRNPVHIRNRHIGARASRARSPAHAGQMPLWNLPSSHGSLAFKLWTSTRHRQRTYLRHSEAQASSSRQQPTAQSVWA